jgi:hypothetical protein
MAAALDKPVGKNFPDLCGLEKILICGNPDCGKTHGYKGDDLLLYDG